MQMKHNNFSDCEGFKRTGKRAIKYERFGEIIRYLTVDELQQFFDSIDNYNHKLMFEVIYELGCRVGEFVKIQVKHLNFNRSTVFFPAANTKTKHARTSYLPKGLTNELKSILRQKGIINKRSGQIRKAEAYVFHPGKGGTSHIQKTASGRFSNITFKKQALSKSMAETTLAKT